MSDKIELLSMNGEELTAFVTDTLGESRFRDRKSVV